MSNSAYIQRQTQAEPGPLAPSHSPLHLRGTAHLYGVTSAPLPSARVLALGCGLAEGLLPFALAYPQARVVGVDTAEDQILLGQQAAHNLHLKNIELYCQDYAALDETLGEFDYIIVTGLYSYLDAETAQRMLDYCARHLSPLGLVYIDYHVYPGAKAQEIVRDAVMLHAHAAQTEAEIIASAQAAMTLFKDGLAPVNPMGVALTAALRQFEARLSPGATLSGPNPLSCTACYFVEFAGRAAQAGLVYAGDSQPLSDIALNFGQGVSLSNSLLTIGQPAAVRQQYLDFATGRGFRQSILISAERETQATPKADLSRLKDLRWASGMQRLAGLSPDRAVTYVNHLGQGLSTSDTAVQTVIDVMAHFWPASVPYTSLLAVVMQRLGVDDAAGRKTLERVLQTLLENNAVHYCLEPSPYDSAGKDTNETTLIGITALPVATNGSQSTSFNLWHEAVRLQLSPQQHQWLTELVRGSGLATLAAMAAPTSTESPASVLMAGTSEISDLLHLLRRYALLRASGEAWRDLLLAGLTASAGKAPYFGLYASALARLSLEAGILNDNDADVKPAQALMAQANKMQELMRQGAFLQAEPLARKLTQISPAFIDAWEVLVACLFNTNQLDDALAAALRMTQMAPADYRTFVLLGICLARVDRTSEAINTTRRAVELAPHKAHAHSALGDALNAERRYNESKLAHEDALQREPMHRKSLLNLCKVLIDAGDIVAAEHAARNAVNAFPDSATAYSNLLFAANYSPHRTAESLFHVYQECDRQLFQPLRAKWRPHGNPRHTDRKLKIGYVSPDFRKHSANGFVELLFSHHDRNAFELTAYAELVTEDEVTARFKIYFDHWVPTSKLTDADLAEQIRADGIDILIDLAGHTQGNRLGVFARKPAPVSLTWMGYGYTTGMSAIDYIVMDDAMAPAGSDTLFAEKVWRLTTSCAYRPNSGMGEVSELPALTGQTITFGTLSRAIRINYRTIRTWAAILQRVPNARLVVDSGSYRDTVMCDALAAQFAAHGISRDRLEIGYHSPPWDVMRQIDIGLDCFPHNSGTTLVEFIYMGVPYLTLADRPSVGRLGSSILKSVGHPELICHTEEEYVDKAVALASDLPALARIRENLRQAMHDSVLMDEAGFTQEFETGLKKMYTQWCEEQA